MSILILFCILILTLLLAKIFGKLKESFKNFIPFQNITENDKKVVKDYGNTITTSDEKPQGFSWHWPFHTIKGSEVPTATAPKCSSSTDWQSCWSSKEGKKINPKDGGKWGCCYDYSAEPNEGSWKCTTDISIHTDPYGGHNIDYGYQCFPDECACGCGHSESGCGGCKDSCD